MTTYVKDLYSLIASSSTVMNLHSLKAEGNTLKKTKVVCMAIIFYLHVCSLSAWLHWQSYSFEVLTKKRAWLGCHFRFSANYHMESFPREPANAQNLIIIAMNLCISNKWSEEFSMRVKIFWDDEIHQ